MKNLKPCPFRKFGVRTNSYTVEGEYTYREDFMPCMGNKCACYQEVGDEYRCYRDEMVYVLGEINKEGD